MKQFHSSHNSWKSTKNVDYHITHRTTTTALYCHFYLAEVETVQLGSNKFHVTGQQLHEAIRVHGSHVSKVREALKHHKH